MDAGGKGVTQSALDPDPDLCLTYSSVSFSLVWSQTGHRQKSNFSKNKVFATWIPVGALLSLQMC